MKIIENIGVEKFGHVKIVKIVRLFEYQIFFSFVSTKLTEN